MGGGQALRESSRATTPGPPSPMRRAFSREWDRSWLSLGQLGEAAREDDESPLLHRGPGPCFPDAGHTVGVSGIPSMTALDSHPPRGAEDTRVAGVDGRSDVRAGAEGVHGLRHASSAASFSRPAARTIPHGERVQGRAAVVEHGQCEQVLPGASPGGSCWRRGPGGRVARVPAGARRGPRACTHRSAPGPNRCGSRRCARRAGPPRPRAAGGPAAPR